MQTNFIKFIVNNLFFATVIATPRDFIPIPLGKFWNSLT